MSDPAPVQTYLKGIFQTSPDKELRGSEVALLLKLQLPGFAPQLFGCFNLLNFIRKFVPEIDVVGKSGGDVIYGLKREKSAEDQRLPTIDAGHDKFSQSRFTIKDSKVWKTFATPNSRFLLCGNPVTSEIEVVPPRQIPPGLPWVHIPSCPEITHKRIAQDFIATLADSNQRNVLSKTLDTHPWWILFHFSARQIGLGNDWLTFRRRRLEEEFGKALQAAGIGANYSLVGRLERFQQDTRTAIQSEAGLSPDSASSPELRRIVAAALERMSDADLRNVWLPIGYVLDALKRV